MNELTTINGTDIQVKEFMGQRVVTFKEIDRVHDRTGGTARKRFNDNKNRFILGEDYFVRISDEAQKEYGISAPNGLYLITESGYLMLVKSFTDDLAWKVQRELVKQYFRKPKNHDKILDSVKSRAAALCELVNTYEDYKDEKYLYPIRNTIFILSAKITYDVYDLGPVMNH